MNIWGYESLKFSYLPNIDLLKTYSVSGTVLGTMDTTLNNNNKKFINIFSGAHSLLKKLEGKRKLLSDIVCKIVISTKENKVKPQLETGVTGRDRRKVGAPGCNFRQEWRQPGKLALQRWHVSKDLKCGHKWCWYLRKGDCRQKFCSMFMPACSNAKLCLTLHDPMDCSPPSSSVHGIFQARILEQVVISYRRESSDPGIEPMSPESPALAGRFLTTEPSRKPLLSVEVFRKGAKPVCSKNIKITRVAVANGGKRKGHEVWVWENARE